MSLLVDLRSDTVTRPTAAMREAMAGAEVEVRAAAGSSEHVAGALVGLGAAEVARRQLSDDDVRRIVVDEVTSREVDADTLERHGATERAGTLRAEAEVLSAVLRHVPVVPDQAT